MTRPRTSSIARAAIPLLPSVMAAILVLMGLGSFGLWEPHETARIDLGAELAKGGQCPAKDEDGDCISDSDDKCPAEAEVLNGKADDDGCPDDPPGTNLLLDERMAFAGWKTLGKSDLAARLPVAILALLAVLALQLSLLVVADRRISMFAGFVLASAPVFLFNARQVTGNGIFLFAETLAVSGLFLAAYSPRFRPAIAGFAMGVIGIAFGTASQGLLLGAAVPALTVLAVCALNRDVARLFDPDSEVPGTRRLTMLATAVLAVGATIAFLYVALGADTDVPLITGGLALKAPKISHATVVLEDLSFAWFPWSALLPILVFGLVEAKAGEEGGDHLRCLAVAGIAVGLLIHTLFNRVHGGGPVFLAVPMALGAAVVLDGMEKSARPKRLGGLFVLVLLAIMLKDFVQDPQEILSGYFTDGIKTSEDFQPILPAGIACAPFVLMVLVSSFAGAGDDPGAGGWRSVRTRVLAPLAAAAIGGYLTAMLVPQLSINMSSKHVVESYERYALNGEPLAVLGKARLSVDATRLGDRDDLLEWLSRGDRVFALFPPRDLAALDREFREETDSHLFVLDAKSEKLILATNRALRGERNRNPIVEYVTSKPFDPPPRHSKGVNFDDKVTLLGWQVDSETGSKHFKKGKEFKLTTFWRCDAPISTKYKMFVHIDGPGPRIHGDHDPVEGTYPTTEWSPGDYIRDVYTGTIPAYQKAGKYKVNVGFYKSSKRMKVVDEPSARDNSLRLGRVTLD